MIRTRSIFVVVLLLCFTLAAGAQHTNTHTNNNNHSMTTTTTVTNSNTNTTNIHPTSTSTATTGDSESHATSNSSVQGNGNNTTVTTNNPHQAPFAYAAEAFPSAPCRVAMAGGGSWLTGGFSVGASKMDEECDKRETARAFALIGNIHAAQMILCTTKAAHEAGLSFRDCAAQDVKPGTVVQNP